LNWTGDYTQRLRSWAKLRESVIGQSQDIAFLSINDWWLDLPWCPYRLHWDDWRTWPDPWQLLEENQFCDLARALGILYTVHFCGIASTVSLAQTSDQHLVLVDDGKYVLNWSPGQLLNISSQKITITKTLDSVALPQLTS
jgi:hypothetical protein